jgi:hypothetical protein
MAQATCPYAQCRSQIQVDNIATEQPSNCPVCKRPILLYKCFSCMKVQAFDRSPGAARPRQCPSCFTLVRSSAAPLGPLPPLPAHLSTIPVKTLEEYGKSGDHPPNEFSVVEAHLPKVPQCGCWVRNDLKVRPDVGALPNFGDTQFVTLKYTVGSWQVFVVWPAAYKTKPPAPNRLGWLPQMEFGSQPGLVNPKKLSSGVRIRFRYRAMSGEDVELDFTPK